MNSDDNVWSLSEEFSDDEFQEHPNQQPKHENLQDKLIRASKTIFISREHKSKNSSLR